MLAKLESLSCLTIFLREVVKHELLDPGFQVSVLNPALKSGFHCECLLLASSVKNLAQWTASAVESVVLLQCSLKNGDGTESGL